MAACGLLLGACGDEQEVDPTSARKLAASYARDDLACEIDADCCAVHDRCRAASLIVSATDRARVAELIELADQSVCAACIPEAVQVRCTNKRCAAAVLEREASADINAVAAFMGTHCGALEVPPGWNEVPRAGGSYATYSLRTVIGCE